MVVAAIATLVAAGTVLAAAAQASDGCDRNVGPIDESNEFTPYEARLSHLIDLPLTTFGEAVDSSDRRIDGLALRWRVSSDDGSSYEYFLHRQPDRKLTVPAFLAEGGIHLDRDVVTGGNLYTADDVVAQVGDRSVKVQIGDYDAALVWADPESNGARPHHLYWSDGTHNNALIAVRGPERMVQLGRELVCGE